MLAASSGREIAANAEVHRFHEITQTAHAATSHIAATHLDVTQSQVTAGESLDAEQPHGLEAMTKTESRAANSARAANTRAMKLVVRSVALRETAIGRSVGLSLRQSLVG
jgi:hypothetical protein